MKNQWLMLLKNEDGFNFVRDFPFILAREAMVVDASPCVRAEVAGGDSR